jgi:hypothetical protein
MKKAKLAGATLEEFPQECGHGRLKPAPRWPVLNQQSQLRLYYSLFPFSYSHNSAAEQGN